MTTRITFHDLSLAVRRLNSIVHPHLINNQPEVGGWHKSLHETDLVGSFILRPVSRTSYALERVILHGNVKDTEVVFLVKGKRAMLDRVNHYADGVQHALLHIPQRKPSPADAAPYNGIYARYICKNTLVRKPSVCDRCETFLEEPISELESLSGLCEACARADSCPATGTEYGTQA